MTSQSNHQAINSSENAEKLLGNESTYIVGLQIETQYEYKDDKRTDKVIGYQVWIATDTHNPFKVKFLPDNKPDLSEFNIGEKIAFDKLEAIRLNQMRISVPQAFTKLRGVVYDYPY